MFGSTSKALIFLTAIVPCLGLSATNEEVNQELASLLKHPARSDDLTHIHNLLNDISSAYPTLKVDLNSLPLDSDSVNIIYFSSSKAPRQKIRTYRNNCFYKNVIRTIVCDEAFITRMLRYYDLHERSACKVDRQGGQCWHEEEIAEPATPESVDELRRLFIYWIMAHEVGHGYYRHEGQFAFASPESRNRGSEYPTSVIALTHCQKSELEADNFFSEVINTNGMNALVRNFFEDILILERKRIRCPNRSLVLHCDIAVGPTLPLPVEPLDVFSTERHPAFLVRLLISMRSIKVGNISDLLYQRQINRFLSFSINHYNETSSVGFDCGG